MSYANILITGASRGIGLELVKQLAAKPSTKLLFATVRDPSKAVELKKIADASENKVRILELEVRDYNKYEKIVSEVSAAVGSDGLNLLVNNAGILYRHDYYQVKPEEMMEVYEVNVVAPLFLTRAFTPLLQASAKAGHKTFVANISSDLSSIANNKDTMVWSYRASKTALNQVTKSMSIQFAPDNIIVAPVHPGWVQTDMGGPNAPIDVKTSAESVIKIFENVTKDQAGLILSYDGTILPY